MNSVNDPLTINGKCQADNRVGSVLWEVIIKMAKAIHQFPTSAGVGLMGSRSKFTTNRLYKIHFPSS
jgi:hypothetical protein